MSLTDATLALFPGPWRTYLGQASQTVVDGVTRVPAPPYVVAAITLPDQSVRSLARASQGSLVRVRATCVGGNAQAALGVADDVIDALEGAHVEADGWVTGRVELVNVRAPEVDRDVTATATNLHPVYVVAEFVFTASRPPTP